jgi:hypothetical protein
MQFERHRTHAEHRVQHHRKQHGVDDDEDHRREAEAEPDQQDRQPRDVADGLEEQQHRPQRAMCAVAQPHEQPERNAQCQARCGAGREADHAVF